MGNLLCGRCNIIKDVSSFGVRSGTKRGYQYWCKSCQVCRSRETYKKRPRKSNENKVERNKDEIKLNALKRMLKYRYSLDYDEYLQMYERQNKCCRICLLEYNLGGPKGLHVDHDHSTGEVRGLLCRNCNVALGLIKENKDILLRIFNYLNFSLKH